MKVAVTSSYVPDVAKGKDLEEERIFFSCLVVVVCVCVLSMWVHVHTYPLCVCKSETDVTR